MDEEALTQGRREGNGEEPALGQEASIPPARSGPPRRSSGQNGANDTCLPGRRTASNEKMELEEFFANSLVPCPREGLPPPRPGKGGHRQDACSLCSVPARKVGCFFTYSTLIQCLLCARSYFSTWDTTVNKMK